MDLQVSWEIDVETVHHGEMVAQELEGNDVKDALEAVDSGRDEDGLVAAAGVLVCAATDGRIVAIADNDGSALTSGDLGECRLNFWIEGIASHDEDDGHVFIDESQRTVLEFTSEDTYERVSASPRHDKRGIHRPSECI
jgi:hypothetical protein